MTKSMMDFLYFIIYLFLKLVLFENRFHSIGY